MTGSPLSLRDPAGRLVRVGDRLFRLVDAVGMPNAQACLESPTVKRFQDTGRFVRTDVGNPADVVDVPGASTASVILEHRAIAFPSYPSEWTPAMLRDAGLLTLDLASGLLNEGRGLKDATPLNVLFDGTQPVFVDALSIENRAPDDPTWLAYGQFVRTFILPLLAARHLRWPMRRTFTGSRDGLSPDELHRALPWHAALHPRVFNFVTGPALLAQMRRWSIGARHVQPEHAKFVLRTVFRHLRRSLQGFASFNPASRWIFYRTASVHDTDYTDTKLDVVRRILRSDRPATVLDIGTNDGMFAREAASAGAEVIAIDRDEAVLDAAYRDARALGCRVTSLVVDLADPTPASGWRNGERLSFLDRARPGFDCVLGLAVLHHLVIGDWLPLAEVCELLATLTRRILIAEFVPANDPYCLTLAAGRAVEASRWSLEAFEAAASPWFSIRERHAIGDTGRTLVVLSRKAT